MSPKILIVEDDADIRLGLEIRLKANKYQVVSVGTATEGIQAFKNEKPNLVVLDLGLPDMSGFEVIKFIHLKPETSKVPVIILTAQGTSENLTRSLLAENVVTFLEKPISNEELLATIQVGLNEG